MAYKAVDEGAAGVDMGHIFQCEAPKAMIQAIRAVVHGSEDAEEGARSFLFSEIVGREG